MTDTTTRPRWPALGAILILTALGVVLVPQPALACDCAELPPPDAAMSEADAVFAGEVTETRIVGDELTGDLIARIAVSDVWKGDVTETVEVRTATDTAMCGYPFQPNKSYLVYANGGAERLRVSLCSRTRPIEQAEEDLAALGMGYVPADPVKADEPGELTTKSPAREPATQPKRPRGGCASCSVRRVSGVPSPGVTSRRSSRLAARR
jgi:hypothetical protein